MQDTIGRGVVALNVWPLSSSAYARCHDDTIWKLVFSPYEDKVQKARNNPILYDRAVADYTITKKR